jgi:hypothetical protein
MFVFYHFFTILFFSPVFILGQFCYLPFQSFQFTPPPESGFFSLVPNILSTHTFLMGKVTFLLTLGDMNLES